jgi:hypothetical protein
MLINKSRRNRSGLLCSNLLVVHLLMEEDFINNKSLIKLGRIYPLLQVVRRGLKVGPRHEVRDQDQMSHH